VTEARAPQPASFTLRQIEQMLGLSPRVIASLVRSGFVTPARGPRNEYRFTFQDVVLMRTARALQAASIPTRRILKSLRSLRESLADELPLSGLRITAFGDRVTVRQADAQWEPESGQLVMDFEVAAGGDVAALVPVARAHEPAAAAGSRGPRQPAAEPAAASDWFERGVALEGVDPVRAEAAYRHAIALAPGYGDPYLNLGALMCEVGRCGEAASLYEGALSRGVSEPLLYFNLAIALEDLGRSTEALRRYADCLERAPDFADAHFNAARLHQAAGHAQLALRHFSAYRRLQK
jgi:tetratricopeptide (TPR) repeat protein